MSGDDAAIEGLSSAEAERRLLEHGRNELREQEELSRFRVLAAQFRSPLLLLLVFAAIIAALTGEWIDAAIVGIIVLACRCIACFRRDRGRTARDTLVLH